MTTYTCPVHGAVTNVALADGVPVCTATEDAGGAPYPNDDTHKVVYKVTLRDVDGQSVEVTRLQICNGFCGEQVSAQ